MCLVEVDIDKTHGCSSILHRALGLQRQDPKAMRRCMCTPVQLGSCPRRETGSEGHYRSTPAHTWGRSGNIVSRSWHLPYHRHTGWCFLDPHRDIGGAAILDHFEEPFGLGRSGAGAGFLAKNYPIEGICWLGFKGPVVAFRTAASLKMRNVLMQFHRSQHRLQADESFG